MVWNEHGVLGNVVGRDPMMFLKREPALWTGAFSAVVNALVLFDVLTMTTEELAGLNVAFAAVLSLVVRHAVTPNGSVGTEDDSEA